MERVKPFRINGLARPTLFGKKALRRAAVCCLLLTWHNAAEGDPIRIVNFLPPPRDPIEFEATAYCDAGITKSGFPVAPGIVAADPRVLPLGSLIRLENTEYRGVYSVLDTGGLVKGRIIDIYMPGLEEALAFGRRKVMVVVLRFGFPKPNPLVFTD